jgi:hypothetical protein
MSKINAKWIVYDAQSLDDSNSTILRVKTDEVSIERSTSGIRIASGAAGDGIVGGGLLPLASYVSAGIYNQDPPVFSGYSGYSGYIGSATVTLWDNADFSGDVNKYSVDESGLTFVPDVTNYIVIDYNSNSPIYRSITDVSLINESDVIPIYTLFPHDNEYHYFDWDRIGNGLASKIHYRLVKTERFKRQSGLEISESATRIVNIGDGTIFYGAQLLSLTDFTSSTDKCEFWYHSAGVWTSSDITTYNNSQYDNGTNLVSLTGNKYVVNWFYRMIETSANPMAGYVLGLEYNSLADAKASNPPTPPSIFSNNAILVGRIIVKNGDSTASSIESAFERTFIGTPVQNHNDLSSIQGGTTDQYYHMTSAEYASFQSGSYSGGHSGASGFSGISGYSGISGDSGLSGYSGISGFSGMSLDPEQYLKLNQVTPQTVLNGAPYFSSGIKTQKIYPDVDGEESIQITMADGMTPVVSIDTENNNIGIFRIPSSNALEIGCESEEDKNYISVMSETDKTRGFSIDDQNGYKWANYVFEGEDGDTLYFACGNSERDVLVMQAGGRIGINVPTLLANIEILRIVQTGGNTYATITCEAPHKLANNTPISIENASNTKFNGDWIISNVTTMTLRINGVDVGAITEEPTDAKIIMQTTIPAALAIFPQYFDSVYSFDKSLDVGAGTGYTNITTDMRTSFGAGSVILPTTAGSYLYIGKKYPWRATSLNIETASSGSTAITIEYSTESGWTALSTSTTSGNSLVDGTSRLTKDGNISWNLKTFKTLWKQQILQVNAAPHYTDNLYWIRISLSGTITVAPTAKAIGNHGIDRLAIYAQASDVNPTVSVDSLGRIGFTPPEIETKYQLGTLNGLTSSKFEVVAEDGMRSDFVYYLANSSSDQHPAVIMARSNGTIAEKTAITNGMDIGGIYGYAYDGSTFREVCGILFESASAGSSSNVAGRIKFKTRNGATSSTYAMTINADGTLNARIGSDSDSASISKVGAIRYVTSGDTSYVDMCMKTDVDTYAWVNIASASGNAGISGYSGISGFSGYSGISGFSGYSGISGFSGYSGISGYSGASGAFAGTGTSGYIPIFTGTSSLGNSIAFQSGQDIIVSGSVFVSGFSGYSGSMNYLSIPYSTAGKNTTPSAAIRVGNLAYICASSGLYDGISFTYANSYPKLDLWGSNNISLSLHRSSADGFYYFLIPYDFFISAPSQYLKSSGANGYIKYSGFNSGTNDFYAHAFMAGTSGNKTNYFNSYIYSATAVGAPTIDNAYSLYVETPSVGTNKYAIFASGNCNFGNIVIPSLVCSGAANISGNLRIENDVWLLSNDTAKTGDINILKVNASNEVDFGATLNLPGPIEGPVDGGAITLFDMPVTSSSASGTEMSATIRIDSTNILKASALSDGAGSINTQKIVAYGNIEPDAANTRLIGSLTAPFSGIYLSDGTSGWKITIDSNVNLSAVKA